MKKPSRPKLYQGTIAYDIPQRGTSKVKYYGRKSQEEHKAYMREYMRRRKIARELNK